MKYKFYTIILVFSITIISIISCTKTDNITQKESGNISKFTVSTNQVEATINGFNQRLSMHEQGFKAGGDLPLGEALWLTEAGVNYEYKSDKELIKNLETAIYTTTIPVYLNDDNEYMVTQDDVFTVYQNLIAFAGEQLINEKVLLVSDVEIGQIENGEADLVMTAVSGKLLVNQYLINETDYWYAVQGSGKCGEYEGEELGKDATWRLNQILNAAQYNATYWTDIVTINYVDSGGGYYLWAGEMGDCITPTEMNFWRINAQGIVAYYAPTSDHHRISVFFTWELIVGDNDPYFHEFDNIKYGIPHQGINPID